jgi:type I restriction enzyme S subunit
MNADRLLKHYERIADAPDAIARLRRFILDLAVRGKLVPQDAKDELASELLKRIAKEKVRRVRAGEIRDPRDLDSGGDLHEPFVIPATWRWARLDTVGAIVGGGTPSAADEDNFAEPGEGVANSRRSGRIFGPLHFTRSARSFGKGIAEFFG